MSGPPAHNYDRAQLAVEVDYRGWILGESALPVTLGETGGDWTDVLDKLVSIRLDTAVAVSDAAFFKPLAATLSVATDTTDLLDLYNRVVRLVYGDTTLFTGTVRVVTGGADPTDGAAADPITYTLTVVATSSSDILNRAQLAAFTAPLEDVSARIARIWPPAVLTDLPARNMPATGPATTDVLTALYECAKVACALFTFDEYNQAQLGAGHFDYRGPDPLVWTFVDDGSDGPSFHHLGMAQDVDAVNTAVTVSAAADPTVLYSRASPGAVLANHAALVVDVVPTTDNVTAIANSLPLATFVPFAPTTLDAAVDLTGAATITRPRLLDRVLAYLQGRSYDGVVVAVSDIITPELWTTSYGLAPGMLLDRSYDDFAPVKPSPVRNLATTARTSATITLGWDVPNVPGGALGYLVRRATGSVAPATPTDGAAVGATLDLATTTITDTGRASATDYAYAVFVTTEDPDVWTRATIATWTTPVLPTPTVTLTVAPAATNWEPGRADWTASTLDTGQWLVTSKVLLGLDVQWTESAILAAPVRTWSFGSLPAPATVVITVQARRILHGVTFLGTKTTKTAAFN